MKVKPSCLLQLAISLSFILFTMTSFSETTGKGFKLALVQMYVEPGELQKNLAHTEALIKEAAEANADVVLLPEVMDLGWTHSSAKTMASEIPNGKTCSHMSKLAKKYDVYLCFGMVEKDGDKNFNSAVIIDKKGKVLLKHRKLNELDIAHNLYAQGDRLGVCTTPWGTFGLMICADATAKDHVLTRSLGYMGADIILSPSSWAVPPDHENEKDPYGKTWFDAYKPVAKEFGLWIASASNVGPVTEGP
ncbi:MAG TPA: carbon-nitrogen hydrolase family protein, partial [Prolixibacteraceae bacterium]|nr:carbon-nitrogen hydrolase family protein [Prolixibacteraceae bacterium]